ncbi:Bacteriophage lambda, GpH, tail tape measure, C-terminal [uncultured Caudovirales phage]|uniref:Bacteriophage lambda, GpH, tail tape measure, C-terminal n=1 Tax=uncultured Caudovirales phage TaxID=2100421 RepID=A0A6J5LH76_9CAUD|nr:Bacteriophage lambda, GpH, tail tape measure, C-terminal [uncultured Caudovirales phage]
MANNVGRLGVVLGLDTAQFVTGLGNASKMLENFGYAVEKYGKMGVAAMVAAGVQALAYADELNDVAQANDTTIASVLRLQQALSANGGEAENAGKIFASFTSYVDKAAEGSWEAQKKLSQMGVSLKDIATLSQQQLFDKALQGSAKTVDSLTRQANAYAVFGKSMKGVDVKGLNEDFNASNSILDEQAEKIKKGAEAWDEIKKHALETKAAIAEGVGPALLTVIEYMKSMESHSFSLSDAFATVLQTVIITGNTVLQTFKSVWDELVHTFENGKTLFTKGIDAAIEENKRYDLYVDEQRKKRLDFEAKILGLETYPDSKGLAGSLKKKPAEAGQVGRPVVGARDKEVAQLQAKVDLARKILEIEQQQNALNLDSLEGNKLSNQYQLEALNLQKELAKIDSERKQALANEKLSNQEKNLINEQADLQRAKASDDYASKVKTLGVLDRLAFQDQLRSANVTKDRVAYESTLLNMMPKEREYMMAVYDIEAQITEFKRQQKLAGVSDTDIEQRSKALQTVLNKQLEIQENTKEQQETFKYGWDEAYRQYVESATNAANIAGQAFGSIIGNMNSAIDEFVRTGKFSFKDFARSVIQDLWAIQLKAQAVKIFDFAQGGIFGAINAMMGKKGAPTASANIPLEQFADGGEPPVGVPSLVGERGPELFIPRTAGTIIPNGSLASAMGGGGQTVNYNGPYIANMSAIDTQTGVQFLAKNKQTIWASYQSANRSMPVSR